MAEKFKVSKKWGKVYDGVVISTDIHTLYACLRFEEVDGWFSLVDLTRGAVLINKAHTVTIENAKFIIDVKGRIYRFNEKDEIKETEEENNGVYHKEDDSWYVISMYNYLWRP